MRNVKKYNYKTYLIKTMMQKLIMINQLRLVFQKQYRLQIHQFAFVH